jgi:hypothetical protein
MSTFIAKYASGTCTGCENPIKSGEEIARDAEQGYVHVDCPDTELVALANKPVCQSCWLVGPCDCD